MEFGYQIECIAIGVAVIMMQLGWGYTSGKRCQFVVYGVIEDFVFIRNDYYTKYRGGNIFRFGFVGVATGSLCGLYFIEDYSTGYYQAGIGGFRLIRKRLFYSIRN